MMNIYEYMSQHWFITIVLAVCACTALHMICMTSIYLVREFRKPRSKPPSPEDK